MRVPQPDIFEHFGNADAVPQLPERCLSRKAGIVRCCPNCGVRTTSLEIFLLYENPLTFAHTHAIISKVRSEGELFVETTAG